MVGESEVSKSLSCSCGAVNRLGISTDYDLNHVSLDVTCKGCGKEIKIELGSLPSNGNGYSPVQEAAPAVEPTQESYDALPNVAGYYDDVNKTPEPQQEEIQSDPLAGMTIGLESNDAVEPVGTFKTEETKETLGSREPDKIRNSEPTEPEDEEDATPDHSEEEEISEEEKEAFSDLFGKL